MQAHSSAQEEFGSVHPLNKVEINQLNALFHDSLAPRNPNIDPTTMVPANDLTPVQMPIDSKTPLAHPILLPHQLASVSTEYFQQLLQQQQRNLITTLGGCIPPSTAIVPEAERDRDSGNETGSSQHSSASPLSPSPALSLIPSRYLA